VDGVMKRAAFHSRDTILAGSSTIAELLFGGIIKDILPTFNDLHLIDTDSFADWLLKVGHPSQERA
jgi:hypothetical protein